MAADTHKSPLSASALWKPQLPLSWRQVPHLQQINSKTTPLPLCNASWLTWADAPGISAAHSWLTRQEGPVFLRGVPPSLAVSLRQVGWQLAPQGICHTLPPTYLAPRHPALLARRALRHISIVTVCATEAEAALVTLRTSASFAKRRPLQHLWRTQATDCDAALLALSRHSGQPMALLTLSKMQPFCWQIETLMRAPQSPIGSLEALILHAQQLAAQHSAALCLGEVPLTPLPYQGPWAQWQHLARRLLASHYAAKGLLRFKQKFRGHTMPLYLAANRMPPLLAVPDVLWVSGLLRQRTC